MSQAASRPEDRDNEPRSGLLRRDANHTSCRHLCQKHRKAAGAARRIALETPENPDEHQNNTPKSHVSCSLVATRPDPTTKARELPDGRRLIP